ncbi:MAG: hypothetical protein CMP86_01055 [Gammaproteobacteria bacterium]|nr:hypothetical protein [Gammaproteobacteria bacterium]
MPLNALFLTDGVLSHTHQSRGLLRTISSSVALSIQDFSVQMHSNWMRGFLRKALTMTSDESLSWAAHCFNWPACDYQKPELIVSAGSETMLVNAVLARRYHCDNLFIGGQNGVRAEWFNAVLTLDAPILPNAIAMSLPPSRLTPDVVNDAYAAYQAEGGSHKGACWAMILGGNGGGCHYANTDWQMLIDGMNQLAKSHKIKWLILTTRLTSGHVQERLRRDLKASYVESISTYGLGLDDPLLLLAARAERIYCSVEHLPILFDSIASGKPTLALLPERDSLNQRVHHLLKLLCQERFLSVLKIHELSMGRIARLALPLPEMLSRKNAQLFSQMCSHCPSLTNISQRY